MLVRIAGRVAPREDLVDWVRQGNVLIELESSTVGADQTVTVPPSLADHIPRGIRGAGGALRERFEQRLKSITDDEDEQQNSALALGTAEQPRLVILPLDDGLYIYGTLADLAPNKQLKQDSNFQFLSNLIQRYRPTPTGAIYVDEVIHGYGPQEQPQSSEANWLTYLWASPLALILVQGGLVTLIWVVSKNQNLGLPQTVPQPARATNAEYIDALAATYERAGASRLALNLLVEQFRRRFGSVDQDLLRRWQGRSNVELRALLEEAQQTNPLNPADLLARADLLHRLEQEVAR
jgi:hypothetical protein